MPGADEQLADAAREGRPLDLRSADPEGDGRVLEGSVVAAIATGSRAFLPRAIVVRGARITGHFSVESMVVGWPLIFEGCAFDGAVNLSHARCRDVVLLNCRVPAGVVADGMEVDGNVDLSESTISAVSAVDARISGNLELDGTRIAGAREPVTPATSSLRTSQHGAGGVAILAERLRVAGTLSGRNLVVERGETRLVGARLGAVVLQGAELRNADGAALCADRMSIEGAVLCRSRFTAEGDSLAGVVSARDARIGGGLSFATATIRNASGPALAAEGIQVGGSMVCRELYAEGTGSAGTVSLTGAHVSAELDFRGARLVGNAQRALSAERLTLGGGLSFAPADRGGDRKERCFAADGDVRLDGVNASGPLSFERATISGTLSLADAVVAAPLELRFARCPDAIDLRGARLAAIHDGGSTWPRDVRLRGCTYTDLVGEGDDSEAARIAWVSSGARVAPAGTEGKGTASPQPFEQLRAYYRNQGDEAAARRVAIAANRHRRASLGPAGRAGSTFLRWVVGYGYRTWQAALWLAAVVIVGWVVFALAWHSDHMPALTGAPHTPRFHAALYALDVALPVVKLGQEDYWTPTGVALGWYVFSILAGWILITAVLGALTAALVRK